MKWLSAVLRSTILMMLAMISSSCTCATSDETRIKGGPDRPITYPENRVPGEYIVKVNEDGNEALVRELFSNYEVIDITELRRSRFLIKLGNDPGPDEVERKGLESPFVIRVQPNYLYPLHQQNEAQ